MLDKGDSVGLVACSDGFPNDNHEVIDEVENSLYDMGYKAVIGLSLIHISEPTRRS